MFHPTRSTVKARDSRVTVSRRGSKWLGGGWKHTVCAQPVKRGDERKKEGIIETTGHPREVKKSSGENDKKRRTK